MQTGSTVCSCQIARMHCDVHVSSLACALYNTHGHGSRMQAFTRKAHGKAILIHLHTDANTDKEIETTQTMSDRNAKDSEEHDFRGHPGSGIDDAACASDCSGALKAGRKGGCHFARFELFGRG